MAGIARVAIRHYKLNTTNKAIAGVNQTHGTVLRLLTSRKVSKAVILGGLDTVKARLSAALRSLHFLHKCDGLGVAATGSGDVGGEEIVTGVGLTPDLC